MKAFLRDRPARRRFALFATLPAIIMAIVTLTASTPAQAQAGPLPLGTFRISVQAYPGYCVGKAGANNTTLVSACSLTDLTQQFT